MNKTKVLITGCAGLFGSHFSKYLLDKGYNVLGIDDLSGGYIENIDERVRFFTFNLLDLNILNKIFESEKPDYVYHFAAYAAEGLSPYIRNFNYSNNVLCSANVINCCINHKVKKLVFTSSMAVYGESAPPYTEDHIPLPEDPYGIAKYAIELDLKQAYRHFGLHYSIVRPHNVHGIYQNIWDKYRNVIGIWIRQSINGESLTIYGDGLQKRAFSDIKYYMEPFEKLIKGFDNELFNIGADKEFTILETAQMVKEVAKEFGYNTSIIFLEERDEVKEAYCNHNKAKKMLSFEDNTDLKSLITDMYKWALTQPNREVKLMEYEIDKNMYSYWKK